MYEKFTFKGVSSETMKVFLDDLWSFGVPEMNFEETNIEGRDGSIITPLNYQNRQKNVAMHLVDPSKHDAVMAWLSGSGVFEINGRYTKAHILGEIQPAWVGYNQAESLSVPIIFEPFWYENDEYITIGTSVVNNGNADGVPLIRVTGNAGTGTITVNGLTVALTFTSTSKTIVIDCKELTEDKPKQVSLGYKYPVLSPGSNAVSKTGTVTKIEMKRRTRWMG